MKEPKRASINNVVSVYGNRICILNCKRLYNVISMVQVVLYILHVVKILCSGRITGEAVVAS